VADYSAALLGALREHGPVEPGADRADVHLYHMGNNQLHRAIYRRAIEEPGVVVLHDAVLHHFFLGCLEEASYVEEFVHNYGEWHREMATGLWRGRARSAAGPAYFAYPMLRRTCESSRAVIVHNPAAARMVAAHAPSARVTEIPHLVTAEQPPAYCEAQRFLQSRGIAAGAFVFGVLGYLRESKRLFSVLRAFEETRRARPDSALLIAGAFASTDLERALTPLVAQPGVVRIGHTGDAEFSLLSAGIDACINLRQPSAGETSGIAMRLMALGKPVILTDSEENSRLPEDGCLRVPGGEAEADALAESMSLLAQFPEAAREIGRRGQAHVREHHALERVAGLYWRVLEESLPDNS
jgi:glycosyltransferase involved in cell wall biosynthesis